MPLALICTCGARLEIDEKFAGQTVTCPDCQNSLQVPTVESTRVRTSGLALVSIILALVGAFTIVGTVAAVLVGGIALLHIAKRPDRIAGKGYAIAGIVLGVIMTAGTVVALSTVELFGLAGLMSDANWAGKLDFPANLEVVRGNEGFAIKRPSEQWGVYRSPSSRSGGDLNERVWDDLLFVLPIEDAVILSFAESVSREDGIERCREKLVREFREMDKVGISTKSFRGFRNPPLTVSDIKRPPKKDTAETVEMRIDKRADGEDKTYLVRLVKRDDDDRVYVVIAGVRRVRFNRLEGQFRDALDSFRLLDRNP